MSSFLETIAPLFDPGPALRSARIRIGKRTKVQGVPAILIGASCIVVAAGMARALQSATPLLPETFREARNLWESMNRRKLNP